MTIGETAPLRLQLDSEGASPVPLSLKARVQQPGRDVSSRQAGIAQERDRLVGETMLSLDPLRRLF